MSFRLAVISNDYQDGWGKVRTDMSKTYMPQAISFFLSLGTYSNLKHPLEIRQISKLQAMILQYKMGHWLTDGRTNFK
ncbi:hypothetical protein AM231_08645 [Paenibacillus solani]|uniref:Uncharacterized protein n=1 Tax=Paenibacillus solani TaxID=1705565 RepID=A0A0M1P408_9BACL|nr:hypothetical protein AM231_08645 [Paenibacillus solani]